MGELYEDKRFQILMGTQSQAHQTASYSGRGENAACLIGRTPSKRIYAPGTETGDADQVIRIPLPQQGNARMALVDIKPGGEYPRRHVGLEGRGRRVCALSSPAHRWCVMVGKSLFSMSLKFLISPLICFLGFGLKTKGDSILQPSTFFGFFFLKVTCKN